MNLSLPPELERWIAEKVAGGQYRNASEVVREDLRLLQERAEGSRGFKCGSATWYRSLWRHVAVGIPVTYSLVSTEVRQAQLVALRRDLQVGLDERERGDGVDGEEAFDRILDRIARAEASAA